jgi:hypothetical protein
LCCSSAPSHHRVRCSPRNRRRADRRPSSCSNARCNTLRRASMVGHRSPCRCVRRQLRMARRQHRSRPSRQLRWSHSRYNAAKR